MPSGGQVNKKTHRQFGDGLVKIPGERLKPGRRAVPQQRFRKQQVQIHVHGRNLAGAEKRVKGFSRTTGGMGAMETAMLSLWTSRPRSCRSLFMDVWFRYIVFNGPASLAGIVPLQHTSWNCSRNLALGLGTSLPKRRAVFSGSIFMDENAVNLC